MILLNTTFCIAPSHRDVFFDWVRQCYLPTIESNDGSDMKFLRLPSVENDSPAFAVQFCVPDQSTAQQWLDRGMLECLEKATTIPYGLSTDSLLHFSTLMEIID